MRFYKYVKDGYIIVIGKGKGGTEITENQYNKIIKVIKNRPVAKEGYGYKLKTNLQWEEYELPADESENDNE